MVLVGNPNVGKSVLFNALTGTYVTVSNYPGTTVEVAGGRLRGGDDAAGTEIVDTPGMYSLLPITEEERVARDLLLQPGERRIVHVVDAKNLERMLPFTLQLIETGLPLLLDINVIDEAERLGIRIDTGRLEAAAGHPGGGHLRRVRAAGCRPCGSGWRRPVPAAEGEEPPLRYGERLETAVRTVSAALQGAVRAAGDGAALPVSARAAAVLLLQGDREVVGWVREACGPAAAAAVEEMACALDGARRGGANPPTVYAVALDRQERARRLVQECVTFPPERRRSLEETLNWLTTHPLTGVPLLLAVLYFGLYQFVGVFGAGTLVDFLETTCSRGG